MVAHDSSGKFQKKVDEEWKQRARSEKASQKQPQQEAPPTQLPPPSLNMLVSGIVADALVSLGAVKNPVTGKQTKDLKTAQHLIDLLQILKEKTKGNLDEGEEQFIESALYELRMRFVSTVAEPASPKSGEQEKQE